jgi:DMSO/TMAO reductase YedYZ molybdopterin-dependent catalytic subunit
MITLMGTSPVDSPDPLPAGPRRQEQVPRWAAGVAGLVGGAAAIGLSEAAAGLARGVPSLVGSVGQAVIDWTPGTLVHFGIRRLGHHDKEFLTAAVLVLCALAAAAFGVASRRRRWPGRLGFGAFGVFGVVTALRDSSAAAGEVLITTALCVAAGLAVMRWLLALALPWHARPWRAGSFHPVPHRGVQPSQQAGRRAFLSTAVAAGGAAVVVGLGGRRLAGEAATATRSNVVLPPVAAPVAPPGPADLVNVPGVSPLVVPARDFYRIDTRLVGPPTVNVGTWRLRVTGMVDRPLELSWDQLTSFPIMETYLTLQCVSNEVGGNLVGNASWRGVRLSDILDMAGVHPDADQIVGRSVDGFTAGFPTTAAFDGRHALVAIGMNGGLLPLVHGFPARLIVAGLYGYVSATKWLSQIELTRFAAYDPYWVTRGWNRMGPILTESRIDTISPNPPVAGPNVLAGVAWAPTMGISKVELQVDDQPWAAAHLADALSADTWRQWSYRWNATPGRHLIRVRATNGHAVTQTSATAEPYPGPATGYHTVQVTIPG